MLIIFGGLPGSGKTTIARELARQIGAVYLRVDTIEQAVRASCGPSEPINDVGYRIANAIAEENLRIGRTVIADSVNPIQLSRDAWFKVANAAQVSAIEIEVKCSDRNEHRCRVEKRTSDIPGFKLPTWQEVVSREYSPWDREHIVIETSGRTVDENVNLIQEILHQDNPSGSFSQIGRHYPDSE